MSDKTATDSLERRVVNCRGCGARIVFLETESGKKIPVEIDDKLKAADVVFQWGRHTAHFANCPKASAFRKPT